METTCIVPLNNTFVYVCYYGNTGFLECGRTCGRKIDKIDENAELANVYALNRTIDMLRDTT